MEHGTVRYAGLTLRFLALLVDLALFCAVFFPVTRMVKGVWLMRPQDHWWNYGMLISDPLCIMFFLVMCAYAVLLEGLLGATVGKLLFRLRVVAVGGGRPGLRRALLRNALRIVDGLPALNITGVVLIVTSAERTRFGDRVAGTRVVVTRARA